MSAKFLTLSAEDMGQLRSYMQDAEKSIDGLSDDALRLEEERLEAKLRRLVLKAEHVKTPARSPWIKSLRIPSMMLGAAALLLFIVPKKAVDDDSVYQSTKGLSHGLAQICEVSLIKSDRSEIFPDDQTFVTENDEPLLGRIRCQRKLELYSRVLDSQGQEIFRTQQTLEPGYNFVGQKNNPVRIKPKGILTWEFVATEKPVSDPQIFPQGPTSPIWTQTFHIRF